MTEDGFLDALGDREGLLYAEPPKIDQPTGPYGITLPVLSEDLGYKCTAERLKSLTSTEAREVARRTIQRDSIKYGFDRIDDEHLRLQLIDFAYNSGPERAIRWLQRAIGMPKEQVTGKLDINTMHMMSYGTTVTINNSLVAARLKMIDGATDSGSVNKKFEEGLESRALSFGIFE